MQSVKESVQRTVNSASAPAVQTLGGGTVMFKRVSVPTSESDLANLDLNVVSDVSLCMDH
jgi:hypothetical protein